MEVQIEKMTTKLKWDKEQTKRERQDQFHGDMRSRKEKELDKIAFNPVDNTLDLSKLRASHLITHRETNIPPMGHTGGGDQTYRD